MPELPEVQAHAERLTERLAGARLVRFEPLSFTALKTFAPAPEAAVGRVLDGVSRRGKHLVLRFADMSFVVHLMQGGRLRDAPGGRAARPKGAVARWVFAEHALLLTEAGTERKAGVWVVEGDPLAQPPLAGLGAEADDVDAGQLEQLLQEHSMRLHTFLRDQSVLAGLGRRLANEVCHRARLSPFAQTRQVAPEAARIAAAIRSAVSDELAAERARDDMSTAAERDTLVHGRTGAQCAECGDVVRAVEYRDYTVNYCASCQTGGKVLADNTTSKFLR